MSQNQRNPRDGDDVEQMRRRIEALERFAANSLKVVTSLPTNPAVGDECLYLANAVSGLVWRLYYLPDGSGYGWKVDGASPLVGFYLAAGPMTYSVANAWVAGYGGATITIPIQGDYMIRHSVSMWSNAGLGTVMYSAIRYSNGSILQQDLLQNQTPGCWLSCAIVEELQAGVPTGVAEQVFNYGAACTAYTAYSRVSATPVRLLG